MADLNISRKNVSKLFTDMQNKKFIVPDYQRPYKWDEEKCETLWEDIISFHETDRTESEEYFLGTIVTCNSNDGDDCKEFEIIDGQQRITSFLLLLRAFYTKLELMPVNGEDGDKIIGLKGQIAPCIWDIDPVTQKVTDTSKIHIESRVATDDDKESFHAILRDGKVTDENNLYSKNFKYFFEECESFAKEKPLLWYSLCVTILQKCIILPIESKNSDTALIIFSTLNDRGMPLSDSDIFKAQIYKSKNEYQRKTFINDWKELSNLVKKAKIELDDIFRYYSHVIRAKTNDKSKEIGLRKFYSKNSYDKLKDGNLIDNLIQLSYFWLYVITDKDYDLSYKFNLESKKFLHILSCYPNDFWKYITSVFFLKNKDKNDFEELFSRFLKNLTAFLLVKFIEKPTVNAIKDDIYQQCIQIQNDNLIYFKCNFDEQGIKSNISLNPTSRVSRSLILLHAYLRDNQDSLLPSNFDIEHILPQKWQNTNYNGWNESDAKLYIEKYGNKVAIEKRLNIQAGNGYFGRKKTKYNESKIVDVKTLSLYDSDDWAKNDIIKREESFIDTIMNYFKTALPVS